MENQDIRPCATCGATLSDGQKKYCSNECRKNRGVATEPYVNKNGYVVINVGGKPVLQHRHVAATRLGRPLPPGARVCHIDGNRINNSPENLLIKLAGKHLYVSGRNCKKMKRCPKCGITQAYSFFYKVSEPKPRQSKYSSWCRKCSNKHYIAHPTEKSDNSKWKHRNKESDAD